MKRNPEPLEPKKKPRRVDTLTGASRSFGVLSRSQLPILAVGLWHYHDDSIAA